MNWRAGLRWRRKITTTRSRNWSKPTSRTLATFIAWARPIRPRAIKTQAQKFFAEAAGFNSLPALNYAFVRAKAQKMAATTKG